MKTFATYLLATLAMLPLSAATMADDTTFRLPSLSWALQSDDAPKPPKLEPNDVSELQESRYHQTTLPERPTSPTTTVPLTVTPTTLPTN